MKILTFAWGPKYRALAERLQLSAELAGLEVEVVEKSGEPKSREAAWALKPGVILKALQKAKAPVLYLDADALIRRPAELAVSLEQSIARESDFAMVFGSSGQPRCSVIWAAPTVQAVQTLQELTAFMEKRGPQSEEPIFSGIARACGAKVHALPPSYNWVEAYGDRQAHGSVRPFIEVNA